MNINFNDNSSAGNLNNSLSSNNDSSLIPGYFDQGQDQTSALDDVQSDDSNDI